jgi:hypothetical protein
MLEDLLYPPSLVGKWLGPESCLESYLESFHVTHVTGPKWFRVTKLCRVTKLFRVTKWFRMTKWFRVTILQTAVMMFDPSGAPNKNNFG